jgi:thiol:disulfide interchange protein
MQTTLLITSLLIAFISLLYLIARARMKNITVVDDNDKILTLTDKNFKNQTENKLVLVDFWASWCAPCRMMAPVLNDVPHADGSYFRCLPPILIERASQPHLHLPGNRV